MKTTSLKNLLSVLLNVCSKELDKSATDKGLENCALLANVRVAIENKSIVVIDNNLRIYQVTNSNGKQFFCNIEDLNMIVNENHMQPGYFKIFHFWNNKAQKVSKKDLKSFFEGAQLTQNFHY